MSRTDRKSRVSRNAYGYGAEEPIAEIHHGEKRKNFPQKSEEKKTSRRNHVKLAIE